MLKTASLKFSKIAEEGNCKHGGVGGDDELTG
jgi:hypothetical protein